jgi:glycine/sarcosine N-methyltransferase
MSTARFYDDLAATYHSLYPSWREEITKQAAVLDRMLSRWHGGALNVVDTACGIGTQLIGLAHLGHRLTGTDVSPGAVARAQKECAAAGVTAHLMVADMRALPLQSDTADAVICADNALPHLLTDGDVHAALREARRVLRPAGTALFTTRDYDAALHDRPQSTLPQIYEEQDVRRITFQLWHWRETDAIYDLEHVQVEQAGRDGPWKAVCRTASYRAYTRAQLASLAHAAGFSDVSWHMPDETGYFQPIMVARG